MEKRKGSVLERAWIEWVAQGEQGSEDEDEAGKKDEEEVQCGETSEMKTDVEKTGYVEESAEGEEVQVNADTIGDEDNGDVSGKTVAGKTGTEEENSTREEIQVFSGTTGVEDNGNEAGADGVELQLTSRANHPIPSVADTLPTESFKLGPKPLERSRSFPARRTSTYKKRERPGKPAPSWAIISESTISEASSETSSSTSSSTSSNSSLFRTPSSRKTATTAPSVYGAGSRDSDYMDSEGNEESLVSLNRMLAAAAGTPHIINRPPAATSPSFPPSPSRTSISSHHTRIPTNAQAACVHMPKEGTRECHSNVSGLEMQMLGNMLGCLGSLIAQDPYSLAAGQYEQARSLFLLSQTLEGGRLCGSHPRAWQGNAECIYGAELTPPASPERTYESWD